ncbi:MAG: ribonucleotide-diphosphate reductase subunit beta, partial [Gemmatimonadaceae bacterium]
IFRFFTQADVEVQDCYHDKYGRVFKPTEIKMMLTAFSNMETVHIAAYSHLLDTIGMPESEYSAFLQYKEMKDKHDYLATFTVDSDEDIARTLAMFGGFTEGLQLFASFAMLMNFPRFNKMKGMGQIVSWSVRDESLHCEGIIKLFHTFVKERDCLTPAVKRDIRDICHQTVALEDAFIELAFEMGPINGMSPKEIKKYIRYIADWRLGQLGFAPIYMVDEHPLPWLAPMLNGVEHANFFETRATEYSKAATRGNWNEVWDNFDRRQKAKSDAAANDGASGGDGPDMFEAAGVAAE